MKPIRPSLRKPFKHEQYFVPTSKNGIFNVYNWVGNEADERAYRSGKVYLSK